jgi:hypothetical protein
MAARLSELRVGCTLAPRRLLALISVTGWVYSEARKEGKIIEEKNHKISSEIEPASTRFVANTIASPQLSFTYPHTNCINIQILHPKIHQIQQLTKI